MAYAGSTNLGALFANRREKGLSGLPTLSVTLDSGLVERASLDRKTETNLEDAEHLLVRKGDIAYNMMRMWQGASGFAEKDGLLSPAYIVLAPKKDIDSQYASYLFKSARLIYLFWAYSYGLTNDRRRLYFNDFKKIPVDIPPLPEQQKIARILSTWDKAIATTEKLIENSKAQKKALMQQLLTGKVRLPGFLGQWRKTTIKQMGTVVSGGTPDTQMPDYWNGNILWTTPTDITALSTRYISNTARKITRKGVQASSASLLPAGTLLVCTRATLGSLAIAEREITTNQGFKSLVPTPEFDSDFLYYLFSYHARQFVRFACGSTFLELSKKDFERQAFLVPSLNEQKQIARILTKNDRELFNLQETRECLTTEKTALMQQLLTGKRRVNTSDFCEPDLKRRQ